MKSRFSSVRIRKRLVAGLILSLVFTLPACQETGGSDETNFESYLPPGEAAVGETFRPDEHNGIIIRSIETDATSTYVIISYEWLNDGLSSSSAAESIRFEVKQGGVALAGDLTPVSDRALLVQDLSPGERLEGVQQAYKLVNMSDDLELSWWGTAVFVFVDGVPQDAYPVIIEHELGLK